MYAEKNLLNDWIRYNSFAILLSGLFALGYPGRIFKSYVSTKLIADSSEKILHYYSQLCALVTLFLTFIVMIGIKETTLVIWCLAGIYGVQVALSNVYSSYEAALNRSGLLVLRNIFAGSIVPITSVGLSLMLRSLPTYLLACSLGMISLNCVLARKHRTDKLLKIKLAKIFRDIFKSAPFFAADLGIAYVLPFAVFIVAMSSPEIDLSSIYPLAVVMSIPMLILRSMEIPLQRVFFRQVELRKVKIFWKYFLFFAILQAVTILVSKIGYSFLAPNETFTKVANLENVVKLCLFVFIMASVQYGKLNFIAKDKTIQMLTIWPLTYLLVSLSIWATSSFATFTLVDVLLALASSAFLMTLSQEKSRNISKLLRRNLIGP